MLADLLSGEILGVFLVFARLGSALMLVPIFGERYVLARQRLLLALLLSAGIAPVLGSRLPAMPEEPLALAWLVCSEIVIGLFVGSVTRLGIAALHTGGTLIALQSGLSAASMYDPSEATQGTLPGAFLSMTGVVLMVALNLHHMLLRGLVASYTVLPPAAPLPLNDMAALLTQLGSAAIASGLQMAAPIVLASLLANVALGVLGRVMPAFQALAVSQPLQLLLAIGLLLLMLAGVMTEFRDFFETSLAFLDPGP